MARGNSKSNSVNGKFGKFKGFVNYEFSEKEIAEMLNYFEGRTFDHPATILSWVDEGFKVAFSWSDFRNCYIASCTANATKTDLDGWCIQFMHSDLDRLMQILLYVYADLY